MESRRSFFKKTSILSALSLGLGTTFNINAKSFEKSKARIIGHGDFKYKFNPNWVTQQGRETKVHHCHEMVEDKKGRLLMTTTHQDHNIIIYNKMEMY